jgi:hypothetical protein
MPDRHPTVVDFERKGVNGLTLELSGSINREAIDLSA